VTVVQYELAGRRARLDVDMAAGSATWRVRGEAVDVARVLRVAPREEVETLLRRVLAEVRAHATSVRPPSSAVLRALAARLWREYASAVDGETRQARLPGL
jgi:hypothetical protein